MVIKDCFSSLHPVSEFAYFAAVIVISMFFLHPVVLAASLLGGVFYNIYLGGRRAVKFIVAYMLPLALAVAVLNPVFNHRGATILFYAGDNPITLESFLYGLAAGAMLISVMVWFSCYNRVMTSEKVVFIFGRIIPSISLIFSMTLRFVPRFKAQVKVITDGRRCISGDLSKGRFIKKAKNGAIISRALLAWSFENSIETADSMRARGYGLARRTQSLEHRFGVLDRCFLGLFCALLAVFILGACFGRVNFSYFPAVSGLSFGAADAVIYPAIALLMLLPMIFNLSEDYKWHRLRSKI